MEEKFSVKRVVLAKKVARAWVEKHSSEEYRVAIYPSLAVKKNLPAWLRSFREGRSKFGSIEPFDFSLEESPDQIVIRTRDYESIKVLNAKIEELGFETTGVW